MSDAGIKRILVALDASEANRSALLTALSLAGQLNAELQALFVEDINLLRLAELPFAREVVLGTRATRQLDVGAMEKQLRAQVERLRRFVETTAQQQQLKVEFKVLRGEIATEIRSAAQQMDLLVMGKNTQLLKQSLKIGKVAQGILSTVNCNVMLLQYGNVLVRPVAVLFDGSPISQRALQIAMQLAQDDHKQLTILYPAGTQDKLQSQVDKLIQPVGFVAEHIQLPANTTQAILQTLAHSKSRVFLLEATQALIPPEEIQTLIQQSATPVLLVR